MSSVTRALLGYDFYCYIIFLSHIITSILFYTDIIISLSAGVTFMNFSEYLLSNNASLDIRIYDAILSLDRKSTVI